MNRAYRIRMHPHPNPLPKGEGTIVLGIILFLSTITGAQPTSQPSTRPQFEEIGHIDTPAIRESSGLVASRKYPGVFWTHNDSGNSSTLFAIDRQGKLIAQFNVNAPNTDWEDIAIDDSGNLYLADIGNNLKNRWQVQVYRIAEPNPTATGAKRSLQPDRTWKITFPDQPFDAESLFILGDNGYIISKHLDGTAASVYRFRLTETDRLVELFKVYTLPILLPVTAADVSQDGKWLAVMTITGPTVFEIDGDVTNAGKKRFWTAIFLDPSCEAVCFVPEGLIATTESRRMILFPAPIPLATPRGYDAKP